jgi:pimeloyl-ACP methyl ester carboxylesterase
MMSLLTGAAVLVVLIAVSLVAFTAITSRRVQIAVPPRGRFIAVGGASIHYLDKGSGPAIILLHGLGGQMGHFAHSLLERLTGEFRVILIDRPGSGYSSRARGASARLSAQAETVAQFIGVLGLGRPLLVGHSLGGAVALALALDHPECVGGLALIAPLTHVPKSVPVAFRALEINSRILRWLVAWTVATPLSICRGKAVLDAIFSPDTVPPDFATKGGGVLSLRPRSFYNTSTDMTAVNTDLTAMVERYASLKVPVSILFGTNDHILEHEIHGVAMKSKISTLHLELVEGGHMLPITAPDLTADFIKRAARSETTIPC